MTIERRETMTATMQPDMYDGLRASFLNELKRRGSMTVNNLVLQITKMTPAEQFELAFKVAENIGYDLIPARCEYCGSGPCENCRNSGYADPEKAEMFLAAIELAKLPSPWVFAKGRTRPDEPLWGVRLTDEEGNITSEAESEHPADAIRLAVSRHPVLNQH